MLLKLYKKTHIQVVFVRQLLVVGIIVDIRLEAFVVKDWINVSTV